jgi:hypothetical protein
MNKTMLYNRKKMIEIQFDNITYKLSLSALSAKDKVMMIKKAKKNHDNAIRILIKAADSMRNIYLLQDIEILAKAILAAEHQQFVAKAILTLSEDEMDFRERLENKVEIMMNARRLDLLKTNKEQLVDKLVSLEMERQIHNAWACTVLEATLAMTLHNENRERIFSTIDEMKASMSLEALETLYEVLIAFLEECGNAQVFLKPHTTND